MNIIDYEFVADATNRFIITEDGANYDLYLSDTVNLGEMLVTVTDPDGDPVEGAFVSTKRDSDIYWKAAETDATGTALITALAPGGGDPTNNFGPGEQLDIVVSTAPGAVSASFFVERTILGTQQIGTGALYETPTDSANAEYRVIFVIPTNVAGEYRVHTTITYAGGVEETNNLIIYIDPAGTVLDLHGAPVEGATVTLFHTLDSGSTRNAVQTEARSCRPQTVSTRGPHQRMDRSRGTPPLQLADRCCCIGCALVVDYTAPSISGSLQIGETVNATTGVWDPVAGEDGNVQLLGMQWLRNGAPILGATGAEYTLAAADEGVVIGVISLALAMILLGTSVLRLRHRRIETQN